MLETFTPEKWKNITEQIFMVKSMPEDILNCLLPRMPHGRDVFPSDQIIGIIQSIRADQSLEQDLKNTILSSLYSGLHLFYTDTDKVHNLKKYSSHSYHVFSDKILQLEPKEGYYDILDEQTSHAKVSQKLVDLMQQTKKPDTSYQVG